MVVFGASGHGRVIVEILQEMGYLDLCVWDDHPKGDMLGYKVVKPDLDFMKEMGEMVIGVGDNLARSRLVRRFSNGYKFISAIHPMATISRSARIGEGTVIMAGAVVNAESVIGKHCIVNTAASIDHECRLGDFVHVSPNATLCGQVIVGKGTHVGAGSVVIQNVTIGRWCQIGAGAVILRDVPDGSTVVGNPGRIVRQGEMPGEEMSQS